MLSSQQTEKTCHNTKKDVSKPTRDARCKDHDTQHSRNSLKAGTAEVTLPLLHLMVISLLPYFITDFDANTATRTMRQVQSEHLPL